MPTTVVLPGTSLTTTAFAPIRHPSPRLTGPIIFAPVPINTFRPTVGPIRLPSFSPIVTKGRIAVPLPTSGETIDDNLTVRQVNASVDNHGVSNAHLREHHREPMGNPR